MQTNKVLQDPSSHQRINPPTLALAIYPQLTVHLYASSIQSQSVEEGFIIESLHYISGKRNQITKRVSV